MRRLYDWFDDTGYLFFCFIFSMSTILVLLGVYILYLDINSYRTNKYDLEDLKEILEIAEYVESLRHE